MRKWRASLSNAGMSLGYQFSEKRQWHKKAHERKKGTMENETGLLLEIIGD